ncbi:phytanoyl-CoA dioxygenase family protein [Paenibacillus lycopersici]|uniref:Phytanoyl-CoA dioxygenase family protein n=1 Tax=Paenibacillus lycopersici TaxID=2704462 RepID=A0A6C0FWE8_9BACL|nr:phytanoyl-CoA dioxygenase family protein [Paenibacillus lycopersici]QHT59791.1 phytanoyl-CoA dioxygenase family protein [Paenibacillus lycopersici]
MKPYEDAQLPDLQSDYPLSDELIAQYREDGHTIVRGAAAKEEIAPYREAIRQCVMANAKPMDPLEKRSTYGKAFIQVANVWERSEAARKFAFARRFAKIAAELMGVDGVRMYHDQALFKEPGGGHTPWHQDQVLWPIDTGKTITMWMPIVDISAAMGSMTFASGSHKLGYAVDLLISDESHRTLKELIAARGFPTVTYGAMAAGDATFHDGWTMHNAPANPTGETREVMTVIYVADGARVAEEIRTRSQALDLAGCIPGAGPGDLIRSPLNPLLYSKSNPEPPGE